MNGKLQNERNDLRAELDEIQDVLDEAEFRAEQLQEQKMMLEEKIAQMKDSFEGEYQTVNTKSNIFRQYQHCRDSARREGKHAISDGASSGGTPEEGRATWPIDWGKTSAREATRSFGGRNHWLQGKFESTWKSFEFKVLMKAQHQTFPFRITLSSSTTTRTDSQMRPSWWIRICRPSRRSAPTLLFLVVSLKRNIKLRSSSLIPKPRPTKIWL